MLPKQVINVVPAGAGVGVMKEEYGRSLQILLGVCGLVLLIACANVANLLLARAVGAPRPDRDPAGGWRLPAQIVAQALVESVVLRSSVASPACSLPYGGRAAAARAGVSRRAVSSDQHRPSLLVLAFAFSVALVTGIIFGAAPAWFATRTDPVDALRGSGRSTSDHSSFARKALLIVQATLSVVLVAGATMLARSLSKLEHQDFGYQVDGRVVVVAESRRRRPTRCRSSRRSIGRSKSGSKRLPGVAGLRSGALQSADGQLGRTHPGRRDIPPPKMSEEARRLVGSRQRQLPPELRHDVAARTDVHRRRQRDHRARRRRQRSVREALLQERRRSARSALRPRPAGERRHLPHRRRRARREVRRFALSRPARPMFYVPLAQNVDYKNRR